MGKGTFIGICVLSSIACLIYRPEKASVITIPGRARLKTDCGYEETLNYYDVMAFFVENARVESLNSVSEISNHQVPELNIFLLSGNQIVLAISGYYCRHPDMLDMPIEGFNLILAMDTVIVNDTISLSSASIDIHFYYERLYPFYLTQTGYTTEIDGHLLINSLRDDTLHGSVIFSGVAKGFYLSMKMHDDEVESWVSGTAQFKATKRNMDKDSLVIVHVLGMPRSKDLKK